MQVLEDDGESIVVVTLIVQEPCGQDCQQGAQSFSPASHNVAGNQGDEGHTGLEIFVDLLLYALQIVIQLGKKRILLVYEIFCGTLEGQCWSSLAKVQAGKTLNTSS